MKKRARTGRVVTEILATLCRGNRVRSFRDLCEDIALTFDIAPARVERACRAMHERGWIVIYRGKRKNSQEWVQFTADGRKEYRRRSIARYPVPGRAHSL